MIDALAKPGGQLLGLYLMACIAFWLAAHGNQTGTHFLDLIIGAILRDMQDTRAKFPNP